MYKINITDTYWRGTFKQSFDVNNFDNLIKIFIENIGKYAINGVLPKQKDVDNAIKKFKQFNCEFDLQIGKNLIKTKVIVYGG